MTRIVRFLARARGFVCGLSCCLVLLQGGAALAEASAGTIRPLLRPAGAAVQPAEAQPAASAARPTPRPAHPLAGLQKAALVSTPAQQAGQPHPKARPAGFAKLFRGNKGGFSRKGAVCGVNAIKGSRQQSFGNPGKGCGIADPVQVTSVSGVRLSQPALMDCTTAKALNRWVREGIKPAFAAKGEAVVELKVAAHYVCRTRNHRAGARLSEHSKGRAVDISAFRLESGPEVSVLRGWKGHVWSKALRKVHASACGPFGTVLGPGSDGYHEDHFHVDTARHRSGPYCR